MTDEKPYDPKRPLWDKSQDGPLPEPLADAFTISAKLAAKQEDELQQLESLSLEDRLNRLDEMQTEAISLANSRAADLMTFQQQFLVQWQREATVAAASLQVFTDPSNHVENREEKIEVCQRALATALYKLGRIDEACSVAELLSTPELLYHIREIQKAKEKDDSELQAHACQRSVATIEHRGGEVEIEIDRRFNTEDVMSELHGQLVHCWRCTQCGEMNASPDTPTRQQRYTDEMRTQIHTATRQGRIAAAFEAGILMLKG